MKRILLIEDNNSFRRLVTRLLTRGGYEAVAMENGRAGLKALRKSGPFDLLITDIVMPEIEGIDLIGQVREHHPDIPIIAISGGGRNSPDDYLKMAQKLGANATLAKPFANSELLSLVQKMLEEITVPVPAETAA